jgi:hypothetical protein
LWADTVNDPAVATPRTLELVRQGAIGVVSDTSPVHIALNKLNYDADASKHLDVPLVCSGCSSGAINNPTATDPDPVSQASLRNEKGWSFRAAMDSSYLTQALANAAFSQGLSGDANGDGKFKISILASDEAAGKANSDGLKKAITTTFSGVSPIIEQLFFGAATDPNSYDWGHEMALLTDDMTGAVTDGKPDVVAEVAISQFSAAIVKAYSQGGYHIPMLHTHGFRGGNILRTVGDVANGQEGISYPMFDRSTSGETFLRDYKAKYNTVPLQFVANSYDSMALLMLATLKAAGPSGDVAKVTPQQLTEALNQLNDPAGQVVQVGTDEFLKGADLIAAGMAVNFEGASGPLDFDKNRKVLSRIAHWRVEGAQYVDFAFYDCVKAPACPKL